MMNGVFITGTDTDVGKTVVTTAIIRFLDALGVPVAGVKPVCCGGLEDVEAIEAVNPIGLERTQLNPYYLPEPAAPVSMSIEAPPLCEVVSPLQSAPFGAKKEAGGHFCVAEGAGGWAVPVCADWGMEDLAVELGFPVILVVKNRLGALNHSILTAQAIERAGLPLVGFFLNHLGDGEYALAEETNRRILEEELQVPCLGEVPKGGGVCGGEALAQALKLSELPESGGLRLHFQPVGT